MVYTAEHMPSKRLVAVKEIQIAQRQNRHQFFNELSIMLACSHPHIVELYNCFFEYGLLYLVIEFCENGPINSHHAGETLPEVTLSKYSREIFSALAYLHQDLRVLHRDIKPANVLLTADNKVKITDFGISTLLALSPLSGDGDATFGCLRPPSVSGGGIRQFVIPYAAGTCPVEQLTPPDTRVADCSTQSHTFIGTTVYMAVRGCPCLVVISVLTLHRRPLLLPLVCVCLVREARAH
jgi:serine/threonine protein kinase